MHDLFSDWLRDAGIDLHDLPLPQWEEGIRDYFASLDREGLLRLLHFASAATATDDEVPNGFREAIKRKDAEFGMRGNTFLVLQLARAGVRLLFDGKSVDSNTATTAALGLVSGSFGQAVGGVHQEHLEAAERYLIARAEELRDPPESRARDLRPAKADQTEINAVMAEIGDATDINQLKASFAKLVNASSLSSLPSLISHLELLTQRLRLREEELNILWWLFGDVSRDIGKPFASLSSGVAAVAASSELADLTVLPPGPRSFQAVLERILGTKTDGPPLMKIATIVNELDASWRSKAVARVKSLGDASALCPIHLMIAKAAEAARPDDWPALVRASCSVAPDIEVDVGALAIQVYRERMFLLSLEHGTMRRGN